MGNQSTSPYAYICTSHAMQTRRLDPLESGRGWKVLLYPAAAPQLGAGALMSMSGHLSGLPVWLTSQRVADAVALLVDRAAAANIKEVSGDRGRRTAVAASAEEEG